MKRLILVHRGDICYFSNLKTNSENEHFENKLSGVEMLMRYTAENIISKCNALELLDALTKLRTFPMSPVSKIDQLFCDQAAVELIIKTQAIFRHISLVETTKDLPRLVMCEGCNDHGTFVGTDFVSSSLESIKEATECLEELFEKGKINREEKEKLEIQISDSQLPSVSKKESTILN